jgi:hypothetical protein
MKNILKIVKTIVPKKSDAPSKLFNCVWLDGNKLVATDTRRLLILESEKELGNGGLDIHMIHRDKEPKGRICGYDIIEGKYCNYERIIPKAFMYNPVLLRGENDYEEHILINNICRNLQHTKDSNLYVNIEHLSIFKRIKHVSIYNITMTQSLSGVIYLRGTIEDFEDMDKYEFTYLIMPILGAKK